MRKERGNGNLTAAARSKTQTRRKPQRKRVKPVQPAGAPCENIERPDRCRQCCARSAVQHVQNTRIRTNQYPLSAEAAGARRAAATGKTR